MNPKLRSAARFAVAFLFLAAAASSQPETYGLRNAKVPTEGVLFGGQPTSEQLQQLARDGYEIINLRMPAEDAGYDEVALIEELGVEYHAVPIDSTALEGAALERFFEIFESAERPVLVHCASGNRVGALYYAYLAGPANVPREEALATARENGLRSDALVEQVNLYLDRQD